MLIHSFHRYSYVYNPKTKHGIWMESKCNSQTFKLDKAQLIINQYTDTITFCKKAKKKSNLIL